MLPFELFGLLISGVQYLGNIVGDPIAAKGDHGGMPHTAIIVDDDIRRAATHIDEHHALLFFGLLQDGIGRGQGGQYQGLHP